MPSELCLTPLHDDAETLARNLDGRLDHGTATELHGQVYIEHYRLNQDALRQCVCRALARIYGEGWREAVDGIE